MFDYFFSFFRCLFALSCKFFTQSWQNFLSRNFNNFLFKQNICLCFILYSCSYAVSSFLNIHSFLMILSMFINCWKNSSDRKYFPPRRGGLRCVTVQLFARIFTIWQNLPSLIFSMSRNRENLAGGISLSLNITLLYVASKEKLLLTQLLSMLLLKTALSCEGITFQRICNIFLFLHLRTLTGNTVQTVS